MPCFPKVPRRCLATSPRSQSVSDEARLRATSNMAIAPATPTFSESNALREGSAPVRHICLGHPSRGPCPPSHKRLPPEARKVRGPDVIGSLGVQAENPQPGCRAPRRSQPPRFLTRATGTISAAPAEMRRTAPVTPTARCVGITIPSKPGAVGATQKRAEIVRIHDAVEEQQRGVRVCRAASRAACSGNGP